MDLVFDLPASPFAPSRARAQLDVLAPMLEPGLMDDLRLLVTELVTNSVRHGPGGTIRVTLRATPPDTVLGDVCDGGTEGVIEIREAAGEATEGGLGLRILDRLARRWGVYEGSTHVWFELKAPRPWAAASPPPPPAG